MNWYRGRPFDEQSLAQLLRLAASAYERTEHYPAVMAYTCRPTQEGRAIDLRGRNAEGEPLPLAGGDIHTEWLRSIDDHVDVWVGERGLDLTLTGVEAQLDLATGRVNVSVTPP